MHGTVLCSLASHTLQSQEKEGLVTMRIASCSSVARETTVLCWQSGKSDINSFRK